MLEVTESASEKLSEYLSARKIDAAVRIAFQGGG